MQPFGQNVKCSTNTNADTNTVADNGVDILDAFDVRYDPVAEAEAILASLDDDAGTEVVESDDRELVYA